MYSSVSNEFKTECKRDVNSYKRIAKIHVVEDNIDITNDNDLVDFTIEETAYSGNTFVGNSVAKKISLNIINDGSYNLEDKEIEVYVGIDYVGDGSNVELIPYGNFIISKPMNEEVKNTSNYIGYDYMIKTEVPYTEDNIVYPMSLYNYLSAICTSVGITLGNQTIPNGNYQVLGDAYTNGEKVRQVIEEIARCCGGFAVIGRDNKLYIKTLAIINDNEDETITPGEYFEDFGTNNTYGPVNRVAIALNYNVVGEDTIREDTESIAQNGMTEIRVSDISFLNSEAQRELVINDFWTQLHNLTYRPYSTNYYGYPYVDSGDIVKITKPDGSNIYSYIFNHKFTYNGAFSGNIEAPALSDVEDEYKETSTIRSTLRNTELKVDKINGEVQSLITQVGDRSEKTTSITQDIDSIDIKISDLEDLTVEVEGLNRLTLENCLEGEVIGVNIKGNNTVFNFLAPSDDLYPADDLFPYQENSTLKVFTKNRCFTKAEMWKGLIDLSSHVSRYYIGTYSPTSGSYSCALFLNQAEADFTTYYFACEPGHKYKVSLAGTYGSRTYFACATFGSNVFEEMSNLQTPIFSNNRKTNSYYDNGWKYDTTVMSLEIEAGANDKYLFINRNDVIVEDVNAENFDKIRNIEPIPVDTNYSAYLSLKGEDSSYCITDFIYYDKDKNYLSSYYNHFNRETPNGIRETEIIYPLNTKYVEMEIRKKDSSGNFVKITELDMSKVKPMLEDVTKYKGNNTYSGSLPNWLIELDDIKNYGQYYADNGVEVKANETTEFEIVYNEAENSREYSAIIGTGENEELVFYTKTDGLVSEHPYNEKMLMYNGNSYPINTTRTFLNTKTKLSFRLDPTTGDYILKLEDLEDENNYSETFDIPRQSEFESTNKICIWSNLTTETKCNAKLYSIKVWNNQELVAELVPALRKDNSRIGLYNKTLKLIYTWSNYIGPGTDGITEFVAPETNFQDYNQQEINLGILEPLRQYSPTVYDEFIYDSEYLYNSDPEDDNTPAKAYVIRRVGVSPSGTLYELPEPIKEILDIPDIHLVEGINYIDLDGYTANFKVKYVQINNFTKVFATQYEVTSQILQLANSISLIVREKVGLDEVIAKINLAVEEGQGVIDIVGNQIKIKSDYFELTADGKIYATAGEIAGFEMIKRALNTGGHTENWSILQKIYGSGSNYYMNGLMVPDNTYGLTYIVAGMPTDRDGNNWNTANANLRILSDGTTYVKNINMNGESGYVRVNFDSGRLALNINKDAISFKIDDSANGNFFAITRGSGGVWVRMYDTPYLGLVDSVHDLELIGITKQDNQGTPSNIRVYSKSYYYGGTHEGYEIATKHDICDERVKKNIKESEQSALDKVNQIEFKQFDWDETQINRKGHIDIGITAQQIKEIDENFVETTTISRVVEPKKKLKKGINDNEENTIPQLEEKEVYSINVLNMVTTALKAIQELSSEVKEQQNVIDKQDKLIQDLIKRIEKLEKGE